MVNPDKSLVFLRVFKKTLTPLLIAFFLAGCSENQTSHLANAANSAVTPVGQSAQGASGAPVFDLHLRTDIAERTDSLSESPPIEAETFTESDRLLVRAQRPTFGDLDAMQKRRYIRVLVAFGRTNFFFDKGTPRGFEYDLLMEYEKKLNAGAKSPEDKTKLFFIPVPFDELLSRLNKGEGDIAAAGLTVTPQRLQAVSFTNPYISNVREVVVTNAASAPMTSLKDLAGKSVLVRKGSSYVGHLQALSQQLIAQGYPAIQIDEADARLSTEDILEMVDSGAVPVTVADEHLATMWSAMLSELRIESELSVHSGGKIAWATRSNSPKLINSLNAFIKENRKGSLIGNILFSRYYKNNRWITNPLSAQDRERLLKMRQLFETYGAQYGINWLELVAQGYQESGLDQSKRSSAGAIGVMQLLQSTASDRSVGIDDIYDLENNIHAGAKYMAYLLSRYLADPEMDRAVKMDFAWASYNAGPNRIRRLREVARERQLDPDRWFANVEVIAAEKIGRETVDYVRNINKYVIAYKLFFNAQQSAANGN